jgi:hypothetical protein
MRTLVFITALLLAASVSFGQDYDSLKARTKPPPKKEPENNWGINVSFSDNGFGFGATKYFNLSKDFSLVGAIMFSAAKDDREFDQYDIYGNSVTPYKENRVFMVPILNIGGQFRLFREDVSDNMRPFFNFGIAPTALIYTPYSVPFFESIGYTRVKYTVGGYAGFGLDYLSSRKSALSFNLRYYYIGLFGEGIKSISTNEKKQYGGIYFIFSYDFLK